VNPRAAAKKPLEEELKTKNSRETIRKSSSWPCRSTTPLWILKTIEILDTLLVSWWIMHTLRAYHERIPLWFKRKITFVAWEWYVWIHTLVVCQWMGFYSDQSFYGADPKTNAAVDASISDEFKAFSTLMYPMQFFPVDVPRIRFSLSQLNTISLREMPQKDSVEKISCDCANAKINPEIERSSEFIAPDTQRDYQTVSGFYLTNPIKKTKNSIGPKTILFWIYGGAYLGGDAEGNLSLANEFMVDCDADSVFIPSYRLAPEATIDDVLWDIAWSYRYLLRRLETESSTAEGCEIILVGISSGGALALRLLQLLRDRSLKLPLMPSFLEPLIDDIAVTSTRSSANIAGAVLFAPYVDYRDPPPRNGSFAQNAKYDWIVTEAVQHYGLPYLNGFIPPLGDDLRSTTMSTNTNGRIEYSPLTHEMTNLPPLCIVASEHEACYDMSIEIVNKARGKQGGSRPTEVTIGVWKYMCHVFSMMQALIPEGRASIEFTKDWIRAKTNREK